jgi:hypothetical protein
MTDQFKEKIAESNGKEEDMIEEQSTLEIIAPKGLISLEDEVAHIEKNINLFDRVKVLSLKLTRAEDWVLQKDSPYLMERGAQTVGIAWGVDIFDINVTMEWMEDNYGRYYMFIAHGKAHAKRLNRTIEDEGTCSQRDKFFGKVGSEWKAVEDVDMTNIRKKAVTNLYGRLIKRVTGLINVTIGDLKLAGIDISKMTKIEYGTGKKRAEKLLSPESLELRKKLWKICMELAAGDEESASGVLEECSKFEGDNKKMFSVSRVEDLKSDKWITATFNRAQLKLNEATKND